MLPNFFVVGAQKSATTSLHHYLEKHPEIYLPKQKETHFFVRDEAYKLGVEYYEDTYFSNWNGQARIGEVDPEYMYFPIALERIKEHIDLSGLKVVFVFRNPVDRAFSHYQMSVKRAIEKVSFEDAISYEDERLKSGSYEKEHFSYVARGEYYDQVLPFLDLLGEENILYLLTEDLRDNRNETLKKIYKFLGVDSSYVSEDVEKNFHKASLSKYVSLTEFIKGNGKYSFKFVRVVLKLIVPSLALRNKIKNILLSLNSKPSDLSLEAETQDKLKSHFKEYNKKLSVLISRDLSCWNK